MCPPMCSPSKSDISQGTRERMNEKLRAGVAFAWERGLMPTKRYRACPYFIYIYSVEKPVPPIGYSGGVALLALTSSSAVTLPVEITWWSQHSQEWCIKITILKTTVMEMGPELNKRIPAICSSTHGLWWETAAFHPQAGSVLAACRFFPRTSIHSVTTN